MRILKAGVMVGIVAHEDDTRVLEPLGHLVERGGQQRQVVLDHHQHRGNGAGAETLYNRVEWSIHPAGHKYAGTAPNGGPSNAATSNNLADAGSWQRVFPERKQIKIARLKTREA